jgi:hypothetical protein
MIYFWRLIMPFAKEVISFSGRKVSTILLNPGYQTKSDDGSPWGYVKLTVEAENIKRQYASRKWEGLKRKEVADTGIVFFGPDVNKEHLKVLFSLTPNFLNRIRFRKENLIWIDPAITPEAKTEEI